MPPVARRPTGRLLLAGALLLLAGCPAQEPHYQGRPLSHWMEDLSNPSSTARMRAAHAVGQIVPEGRKAIPILIRLLDDKAHLVRWAAASSLERFGADSRDALPALEKLAKNDPEPSVRDAADSASRSIRMVVEHLGAGR